MTAGDKYLRPFLDAGSSRVFNLLHHTQRLNLAGTPPQPPFFRTRRANNLVILKYAPPPHEQNAALAARAVQTKLYLPFNEDDIYEGGQTILLADPRIDQVLAEQLAMSPVIDPAAHSHDRAILALLDGLPSLDPFLMRDRFELEQIAADDAYFALAPAEFSAIKAFVREKMMLVAGFAVAGKEAGAAAADRLTQKLWEAKDAVALKPVIDAFRIHPKLAPEVLHSWKGTIYFDFAFERERRRWQGLTDWLTTGAEARVGATPERAKTIAALRDTARDGQHDHWRTAMNHLNRYRHCFDTLFVAKKDAGGFTEFLKGSKQTFWELGDAISRLSHAHNVWEISTNRFPLRQLPAVNLIDLLNGLIRVYRD